jgi:hypothetical protein
MNTEIENNINTEPSLFICKETKRIYVLGSFINTIMDKSKLTYYLKNRDSKLQYQKEYNSKNKDSYLEYQKSYYENKREDILNKKKEKVICECGRSISFGQLTNHKKTKLHLKHLQNTKNIVT